jgi:Fic family protein
VTIRAIKELHEYIERKALEIRETRLLVQQSTYINAVLNHRQLALVNHAMKNPRFLYTIESHRRSHNVSYQTARTDLLTLAELGLVDRGKSGKAFVFFAPPDLRERLQTLAQRPGLAESADVE